MPTSWPERERPAEMIKAQAAAAVNGVFVAVANPSAPAAD